MTTSSHPQSQPARPHHHPHTGAGRRAERAGARFKRKVQLAPKAAEGALGTPMEEPGRRNEIRRELRRLDKAWAVERERHMVDSGGRWGPPKLVVPDWRLGIGWLLSTLLFLYPLVANVPILEYGTNKPAKNGKTFLGLIVLFALYWGIRLYGKSIDYHQAFKVYQRRRAELLAGELELAEDWEGLAGADWIPGQPSADL